MPRAILTSLLCTAVLAAPALAQQAPAPAAQASVPLEAASAIPSPPAELAGDWDLRIDGTTIFRFTIQRTAGGAWQGRWQRPDSFNSNGNAFANLRGGVKSSASMAGNAVFELVELAFEDPRPGAVPDIFRFRLVGPDQADMTYVGTQLAPFRLVRARAGDALGNWDAARIYRRPAPGARPAGGEGLASPASPQPSRAIQPTPDGRIMIGPQVPFLDLTRRTPPAEDQPAEQPAASAPSTPSAAPSAAPESQISEDFLEGL